MKDIPKTDNIIECCCNTIKKASKQLQISQAALNFLKDQLLPRTLPVQLYSSQISVDKSLPK